MDKQLVLSLKNHDVYYVKSDVVNYYITVPKSKDLTNISIEIKTKVGNYNLELNDEVWVMENVKTTFSFIDAYNITLVLPVLKEEDISILEKIGEEKYQSIDKLLGYIINSAYKLLKDEDIEIDSQIILVNNDRYSTFINWFTTKYKSRVVCKTLLELIQLYNANATTYKKMETPVMNFVIGNYNQEVDAPKIEPVDDKIVPDKNLVPQTSSGFTSYWLLAIIVIVLALGIGFIVFMYKK